MGLISLLQIWLTYCYLGYCTRSYLCLYSLCQLFFTLLSKDIQLSLLLLFLLAQRSFIMTPFTPYSPAGWPAYGLPTPLPCLHCPPSTPATCRTSSSHLPKSAQVSPLENKTLPATCPSQLGLLFCVLLLVHGDPLRALNRLREHRLRTHQGPWLAEGSRWAGLLSSSSLYCPHMACLGRQPTNVCRTQCLHHLKNGIQASEVLKAGRSLMHSKYLHCFCLHQSRLSSLSLPAFFIFTY